MKPTKEDRERVAKKLLDAETAYYDALRLHREQHTEETRVALAEAQKALAAIENWAVQVGREEVVN